MYLSSVLVHLRCDFIHSMERVFRDFTSNLFNNAEHVVIKNEMTLSHLPFLGDQVSYLVPLLYQVFGDLVLIHLRCDFLIPASPRIW